MKALVINLDKATERMAFQTQQLSTLAIDFQRLAAVSIDQIDQATYDKYSATWERPLRQSEIACFLSHQHAWETIIEEDAPMLVLEDDALLSQNTPSLLEEFKTISNVDYVTLEIRSRKKIVAKQSMQTLCESKLIRLYQDRTGAAGYVLWPSGAKKLLQRLEKGQIALADAFISSTYSLLAYQIEPATIIQLDQCEHYGIISPIKTESSITIEVKPSAKVSRHWSFRVKRILGQLRLGIRQLRVIYKSKRRYIRLESRFFIR